MEYYLAFSVVVLAGGDVGMKKIVQNQPTLHCKQCHEQYNNISKQYNI